MSNEKQANHADNIRSLVRTRFAQLGAPEESPIAETLLIRNGFFCGRRYSAAGLQAVWFFEENQLKIYGTDGSVASVVDSASLLSADMKRAA